MSQTMDEWHKAKKRRDTIGLWMDIIGGIAGFFLNAVIGGIIVMLLFKAFWH
jgi:hypothetical protein